MKIYNFKLIYIIMMVSVCIISCVDEENTDTPIGEPIFEPKEIITTTLSGIIVDENGSPVSSASVNIDNAQSEASTMTDENGYYEIFNADVKGRLANISIVATNMFDSEFKVSVSKGSVSKADFKIYNYTSIGSFQSTEGRTLTSDDNVVLEFSKNSIVNSSGVEYQGDVEVYVGKIDPTKNSITNYDFGGNLGENTSLERGAIYHYQSIQVELKSPSGELLSLVLESAIYYSNSKSKSDYIDPLPSFDLNLAITYPLSNLVQLKTGIEYLQINEKFYFENVVTSKEKIFVEDALFTDNNNIIQFFEDSVYVVSQTLNKRTKQNKYQNWNIPIGIVLSKGTGEWTYGLDASAIINLSSSFNGYLLNDIGDDVVSVDGYHDEFNSRIGLGFRIQPNISYSISSNLNISLATPFRMSPYSDTSTSGYWKAIGLSAAIRYRLRNIFYYLNNLILLCFD